MKKILSIFFILLTMASMATPMQTFLNEHATKFTDKCIVLLATSSSNGISTSPNEAQVLCSETTFTENPLLTSSTLSQMPNHVITWLEQLGVGRKENNNTFMKMNITFDALTVTATMEANDAAWDFLSRLPLEVMLEDYNNITEKIFPLWL